MKKNGKFFLSLTGVVLALSAVSCGPSVTPSGEKYTYRAYLTASPTTWNVHTWQESSDSYIQGFTEMGLYDCIYNKDESGKEGYVFVSEMASQMPIAIAGSDVTDEEAERYGLDDSGNVADGMVWDIKLNQNAVFENGDKINADTYVESMKRLLDPEMANFRADSYYASNLVLANAETYYKQGTETNEPCYDYFKASKDGNPTDSNFRANEYYLNLAATTPYAKAVFGSSLEEENSNFYTVLNNRSKKESNAVELAAQRITDVAKAYAFKVNVTDVIAEGKEVKEDWENIKSPNDISKSELLDQYLDLYEIDDLKLTVRTQLDVSINEDDSSTYEVYTMDKLIKDLSTFVYTIGSGRGAAGNSWNYVLPLFGKYYNDEKCDWSSVGIAKIDDYTIRLYCTKVISDLNLKFALTSNWIVNIDKYDSLTSTAGGKKFTKYASDNADNYVSYGPYKLTYFKTDDSFTLTKNSNWYGYTDGQHVGQFQMTDLTCRVLKHDAAKQEFKIGNLDEFSLEKSDMEELGNSQRAQYTPESYTTKISFNTDWSKLKSRQESAGTGINKTLLNNDKFRTGISLCINRKNIVKNTTGSQAYTYLLNSLYLTDVEAGEAYRSTTQGKGVYDAVYNKLGGENGGEALSSSANGYNYTYGIKLIKEAIAEELASEKEGSLTTGDKFQIIFKVYDDQSDTSRAMWNDLNTLFNTIGSEVGLDMSITLEKDEDYYNSASNGNYDMIFSTWGGAAINPWGLMQVYCASDYTSTCEYGFKGKQASVYLSIDVDGDGQISSSETKSYDAWYKYLNNTFTDLVYTESSYESYEQFKKLYDERHTQRLNILAGLEAGIISRFEALPLYARSSADITSFKVDYATNNYINLIGYGGIRFMTFNYSDTAWAQAIANGTITYDMYKN